MEILRKLIDEIENHEIKDSFVGAFDTVIESKYLGISSTLKPSKRKPFKNIKIMGNFTKEVSKLALSENELEASIGIAAINSALNRENLKFSEINAYDILPNFEKVGIIGRFPFIDKLKKQVKKVYVFELNPLNGEFHSDELKKYSNEIDIIALTATSLINHTFEKLMENKGKAKVLMLGPSTPLSKVLFDYGIDIISGTLIEDKNKFIGGIKEGKGFKHLEGRKSVTIFKNDSE